MLEQRKIEVIRGKRSNWRIDKDNEEKASLTIESIVIIRKRKGRKQVKE